jgi:hypothetical protein
VYVFFSLFIYLFLYLCAKFIGTNALWLTFAKGDLIEVLSMETGKGWWHGRLQNGKSGVFPSNYVKIEVCVFVFSIFFFCWFSFFFRFVVVPWSITKRSEVSFLLVMLKLSCVCFCVHLNFVCLFPCFLVSLFAFSCFVLFVFSLSFPFSFIVYYFFLFSKFETGGFERQTSTTKTSSCC